MPEQFLVPLVLSREWALYAFPAGVKPTDERGLELGPDEVAQLVQGATRGMTAEIARLGAELNEANAEIESLRSQLDEEKRSRALAELTGR